MVNAEDPWVIIDPEFRDPAHRQVAQAVITMVASGWSEVVPIDVADPAVLGVLDRHRVSTLVPLDAVADDQREMFRDRLMQIYRAQMRIQATAIDVLERLTAAGLESRVLKGLASAELDYPRMELRQTGDVDLAVRPSDVPHVRRVLSSAGYRDYPAPAETRHLTKGITLIAPSGIEVDVHNRIFRRSSSDDALIDGPFVALSSVPSRAFAAELRLVHAAGHFVLTPPRLRRLSGLMDVTSILNRHEVDLAFVTEEAKRLRVYPLVFRVLQLEAELTGRARSPELDEAPAPSWLQHRALLAPERRLVEEHFFKLSDVPPGVAMSYLPTWLSPSRTAWKKLHRSVKHRASRRART